MLPVAEESLVVHLVRPAAMAEVAVNLGTFRNEQKHTTF